MHLRLAQAVQKLTDDPCRKTSLSGLAKEVGLSPRHLEFLFKTQAEITFVAFCSELRMRHARQRLAETSEPIKEIAFSLGYKSVEVFCREFKRVNGCTATEFRSLSGKRQSNLGNRQLNSVDKLKALLL